MVCTYTVSNCTTLVCSSAQIEWSSVVSSASFIVFFLVSYLVYKTPNLAFHCNVFRLCNYTFVPAALYRMLTQIYVMTPSICRLTQLFWKFYKSKSAPFKSWITKSTTSQILVLSLWRLHLYSMYVDTRLCVFALNTSCPVKHDWT
jgi:hypothetical protein